MKRRSVITGSLFVLLSVGGVLLTAKQQQNKIKTTPAPPLPVEPAKPTDVTGKTVAAANAFLATLDDAARAKVGFPFNSDLKVRWSNFPVGVVPRNGLRLGDLSARQREAAMKLLGVALSRRGLQKVKEIIDGDEVLKKSEAENPSGPMGPPPDASPGRTQPGRKAT